MSRSFIDAIRGVVLKEGAKDKTDTGMTKDAKHFVDLHKVNDVGTKYLAQNDGERKTYEKMFNGDVDRAPSNLGSYAPGEDLNKYVEYNEHVEIEEAKKKRGCSEDCKCDDCSSDDKEEVKEAAPMPPGAKASWQTQPKPGATASAISSTDRSSSNQPGLGTKIAQNLGMKTSASQIKPSGMSGNYPRSAQTTTTMAQQTKSTSTQAVDRLKAQKSAAGQQARMGGNPTGAPQKPGGVNMSRAQAIETGRAKEKKAEINKSVNLQKGAEARKGTDLNGPSSSKPPVVNKFRKDYGLGAAQPKKPVTSTGNPNAAGGGVKIVPTSGEPPKAGAAPTPKAKPTAPAQKTKPAAPAPSKPAAAPPVSAAKRQEARRKLDKGAVGPEAKQLQKDSGLGVTTGKTIIQQNKPKPKTPVGMKRESFEFEVNGTSYIVSEAHASAIAAFIEKYGMVNEGTAGDFIKKEMEHPEKLTAKGKKQKIKQALAIYYSKKRRGENP